MRHKDIDIAKGIGIFLVVLGHIVAREIPNGNAWYGVLKKAIYQFHMPFFMYLSGLIFFLISLDKIRTRNDYWSFAKKRAYQLLLPFFLFGVLIIIGKILASHILFVDNLPDDFFTGILNIFWDINNSPATSIWYIFVLFVFSLLTPPLM